MGLGILDGALETEWSCSGVGEKSMGLPERSVGFTFNGTGTGGIHNLFYTLRVYIQYNKICSNKIHVIAKALIFTNKC